MLRVIGNDQNLSRQEHAIASGTLPNGKPVIVNADGTVSVVAETPVSENKGTEVTFDSSSLGDVNAVYDETNNKLVVVYHDTDGGNQATYVVGTVSGTSISFGSPTVIESGIQYNNKQLVYHAASGKLVLVYRDTSQSGRGEARVGTVSGTSISWGTATVFESGSSGVTNLAAAYDASTEKVVIIYRDDSTSNYGTAIVGTVSGTSISFGTKVVFLSATVGSTGITYDASAQKMVVCYHDGGNSYYGTAIVGTVSGTSISFGSAAVFYSGGTASEIAVAYDANSQKNLFVYRISSGTQGVGIVGTVSGTSILFGSQSSAFITVDHDAQYYLSYHAAAKKVVVAFRGASNYPYITVGTISGTSVTFTTPTAIQNASGENTPITYDPDTEQSLIAFRDAANSNYGSALTYVPAYNESNITSENYIGIARSGAASGAGAIIDTQGAIANNLSGLTAGQSYYVQTDGTLSTTADDPSVFAGTAVSATELIVKG